MKSMPRKPPRMLQVPVNREGFSARELYHGILGWLKQPLLFEDPWKDDPISSLHVFLQLDGSTNCSFNKKYGSPT